MGVEEIRADLSYLATDRKIAASTQNIALSALLFFYHQVLTRSPPSADPYCFSRNPTWRLIIPVAGFI